MQTIADFKVPVGNKLSPSNPKVAERLEKRFFSAYRQIVPYLAGRQINSMLGIGCGGAIVEILLAKHFGVKVLHLLDGDGSGVKVNGFQRDTKPFYDVKEALEFAKVNLPDAGIEGHQPDTELEEPSDLIVSF